MSLSSAEGSFPVGKRQHFRAKMVLPIRVWGKDLTGKTFEQLAYTLDISHQGARLGGIRVQIDMGSELDVQYKHQKATFRVAWVGQPGTRTADQAGIECIEANKYIWPELPNATYHDPFVSPGTLASPQPAEDTSTEIELTEEDSEFTVTGEAVSPQHGVNQIRADRQQAERSCVSLHADQHVSPELSRLHKEICDRGLSTDAALALIADTVCQVTKATGAAIACVEDPNVMVCLASSGWAPERGVRFRVEAGISAECTRSGLPLICEDTDTDPRVDDDLCRRVNIRSGILIPLRREGSTVGLLEVFGSKPSLFNNDHVLLLEQMAVLAVRLLVANPNHA
jgi:GAF domain-containing protein